MRSVPRFLWGSFRVATKLALEEILKGEESGNLLQQERAWKLFLLLPRNRSPTGGGVPKAELVARFDRSASGLCLSTSELLFANRQTGVGGYICSDT